MKNSKFKNIWVVLTLFFSVFFGITDCHRGLESHKLELQKPRNEAFEKSRPRVEIDPIGSGWVKVTIESYENGFYKKESFFMTQEECDRQIREIQNAPPIPRN